MTNLEQTFLSFLKESDSPETVSSSEAIARSASAENKEAVAPEPPKRFWWLKTSRNTDEGIDTEKKPPNASTQSSVSSSMAEFLAKERLCREGSSKPSEKRSRSPESRVDEYSEDFTDDDISSIMDQISLLAGSGPEDSGSKSVDDILREAEEVVQVRQETSNKKRGAIPKHKDYGLPPPLSKPPTQLIVNLKEKKRPCDNSSEHKVVADDANAIFDQIDREVRNKIAAARLKDMPSGVLVESNKHSGFDLDDEMKQYMNEQQSTPNVSQVGGEMAKDVMRRPFSPLKNQPLSIVIEESLSDVSSLDSDVPSHSQAARNGERHKPGREASHNLASRKEHEARHKANHNEHERGHYASEWSQKLAEGSQKSSSERDHKSSVDNVNRDHLMEERKKYEQLRAESDQKQHDHKQQLSLLKRKHEGETLALERDLGHFKAKLKETEERSLQEAELGGGDASNPRLRAMEQELQKQEQISQAYQSDNINLRQELTHLKSELRARETQHEEKFSVLSTRRDTVKWLSEKEELNEKVKDRDERILALNLEIEMLKNNKKDVEKSADKLKLQSAHLREEVANDNQLLWEGKSSQKTGESVAEKEVNRQTEDSLRKDEECERLRHELRCVENELEGMKQELHAAAIDARRKGETVETRIASLETELEREREKSRLCRESEHADKASIQDLTRQVGEMEHVIRRNHPDSISALIRAANCEPGPSGGDSPRVQFLEERVKQLEDQLGNTKAELECSVSRVQDKYTALKDKYDVNTASLSAELAAWKQEATAMRAASKKNAHIVKEDSHLLATIRGLQQELAAKEKAGRVTEKKLEDANKTNKRLQAEREKILQQPKALDNAARKEDKDKDNKVLVSRLKALNVEKEDQILQLQSDLMLLRERRLQDLEELQLEHEVEMQLVVAANSTHAPSSRLSELHAEIYKQQSVIEQLKVQLAKLDECRAEVLVLKVEREHLEKNLKETNKKLNILRESQTPDDTRQECLLDKISQLEIRHESREQKLQSVVRDLLRINQDKGTSANLASLRLKLKQKDEEIWQFKLEMDQIVKRLMELEGQVQGSQASD